MRHMPSGYEPVNVMWMWAALLGLNTSTATRGDLGSPPTSWHGTPGVGPSLNPGGAAPGPSKRSSPPTGSSPQYSFLCASGAGGMTDRFNLKDAAYQRDPARPPRSGIAPVLDLAERTLTVGHLVRGATLYAVAADEVCAIADRRLAALGLDTAPLDDDPPRRFVQRANLEGRSGPVSDAAEPIDAAVLIAADLPLSHLIDTLDQRDFVFVLDGDRVSAIVTRADLQNPLIALYVLGLLVGAERALDQLIVRYTNNDWQRLLSDRRLAKIQSVYEDRVKTNTQVDLLSCSNLDDRLELVAKIKPLRAALGWQSRRGAEQAAVVIKSVRNCLAHGDTVLSALPKPGAAIAAIHDIRRLAEDVWRLVYDDDNLGDIYAASILTVDLDGNTVELNGPIAGESAWPAREGWLISAANPMSVTSGDQQNARNHGLLAADLTDRGYEIHPAARENGEWREEGWLVFGAPEHDVLRLGQLYGQRAVFHLDDTCLEVVACADGQRLACRAWRPLR